MSPLMSRALNPFIQVLRPVSPLAWMPLALYTIKDSAVSSVFVIFICARTRRAETVGTAY